MHPLPLPLTRLCLAVCTSLLIHIFLVMAVDLLPRGRVTPLGTQEQRQLTALLSLKPSPRSLPIAKEVTRQVRPDQPLPEINISGASHQPPASPTNASRDENTGLLQNNVRYFNTRELDVSARPIALSSAPRAGRVANNSRMVRIKMEIFISEDGKIDHLNLIESDVLPDDPILGEIRELRFHPAQKDGIAVKSRKIIELSFVP